MTDGSYSHISFSLIWIQVSKQVISETLCAKCCDQGVRGGCTSSRWVPDPNLGKGEDLPGEVMDKQIPKG